MNKRYVCAVVLLIIVLLAFQASAFAACDKCYNGEYEWYFICTGSKILAGTDSHAVWFKPLYNTCTRTVYTSPCTAYCRHCSSITSTRYMDHLCYREHSFCIPSYESLCMYPE